MKYNVSFTKRIILTAVIFIIGLILSSVGLSSYYKYNHALDLQTLNEQELNEGKHVVGNIDTYIREVQYENNMYYDVSQTHVTGWKTYDYYTVPIEEDSYITLLISDESIKDQLDTFEDGHGEGVYFEGIVIEPPRQLNYELDEGAEEFNPDRLIDSFVIQEAKLKYKNLTIGGILLLILAVFLFIISGGNRSFISVEKDETDYSLYKNTLHKDDK